MDKTMQKYFLYIRGSYNLTWFLNLEYARLQSFPDWFDFKGKYTTGGKRRKEECPRYTQVGNAVPPLLSKYIGRCIKKLAEGKGPSR